jgi:hypothetical protein
VGSVATIRAMTINPQDLPPLTGPQAWLGPFMQADPTRWTEILTSTEIAELEQATARAIASNLDPVALGKSDFPLPNLGPKLQALKQTLLHGCGFALFRGVPVQRWSMREAATAFLGIGAHLGVIRSQNAKGHVLGHVRDLGLSSSDPNVRVYQTHERQTFHTDSCDVVGLLCLQVARSGGKSALVSAVSLFNEMRRRRPDLLRLLMQPVAIDRRGEAPPGEKPYFLLPPFSWHEGQLTVIYQRQYIDSAQRFPDAPRLTPDHVAALDLFDALADDPALNFEMELAPGDMQFVHNHTMLHDRTGFEDWPEAERRRHLLRLWLALPEARNLPDCFRQRYGDITPGRRGGVDPLGVPLNAPLVAV